MNPQLRDAASVFMRVVFRHCGGIQQPTALRVHTCSPPAVFNQFYKKMSRHGKKKGIPDRWLDYKAVGKRLHGTRFIAFKVPLKQALNRCLPLPDVFGPWELLDIMKKDDQELGLIIDLTFTSRYYGPQDVPESLLCVKIDTPGHMIPPDDTILNFKRAVRRFLRDNTDNDKLIGVHCTHGLNRTGYLICRYLIDVDGMDPGEAVQLFNSARGHEIERDNYLEDLRRGPRRSNEGMEESQLEPVRGGAGSRPRLTPSDSREERRPHNSWRHRSHPARRMKHHSPHHPSHDGYPPSPLPPNDLPPNHPYRWQPPGGHWRRPAHPQEDRQRAHPPLPHYSPPWSNRLGWWGSAEEPWAGPNFDQRDNSFY
ncbi:RNA/RNP complex-1-interacting phosphatase [Aulostomus maculatus]